VQRRAETPQDPAHGSRAGKYDPFVFKLEQVPRKRGSDSRCGQAVATRQMTNFHDSGAWYLPTCPFGKRSLDRRVQVILEIQGLFLRCPQANYAQRSPTNVPR